MCAVRSNADARIEVSPSPRRASELASNEEANLIALTHTFIADCDTPVSAFLKLRALAPSEPAFLLESAEQGQRMGRYSFIGFRPRSVLRWSLGDGGDPYALAAATVAAGRQATEPGLAPFTGGAVGYFGYDLVRTVEPLGDPNPDELGLPDMALMMSDVVVTFDHLRHSITILANADLEGHGKIEDAYTAAVATISEIKAHLAGAVPAGVTGSRASDGDADGGVDRGVDSHRRSMPRFQANMPREGFEGMVARIVRYIHAGDAFQVVPSQRWSAPVPVSAFSIYRGLRTVNPSPYMYFLDFCDFQIAGASPEPLLTVTGGSAPGAPARIRTRPIAGTRPRGADPEDDRRIAAELLADEKERAEHVMLVDLGRNDLGRVCRYGTVAVDEMMEVEYYSHVMHIVSSVSGILADGVGPMDALRSVLPAGTLSGAPKVRAMQIIDELEPVKRGGYGGAIGYLGYSGDLDTAIHIRTVVVKDGIAHLQAGGGTVADAEPAYEFRESVAKSDAVIAAVRIACEQDGWE